MKIQLSDGEASTISNALFVAADRFKENAEHLRHGEAEDSDGLTTIKEATRLAEQFDRQEKEARGWAKEFSEAEAIIIQSAGACDPNTPVDDPWGDHHGENK